MKNKLQLVLLIGFILSAPLSFGQLWVEMMLDPNANFYETQEVFNEYWEGKTIEKGKGYKQFKRWEQYKPCQENGLYQNKNPKKCCTPALRQP